MKQILATLLIALSLGASANDDKDWGHITTLDNGLTIHGKYKSFETFDGVAVLLLRFTNPSIVFTFAGISQKTCAAGYGELVYMDLNYKVTRRVDYVRKGGNGTAAIGDLMCNLLERKGQTL